MIIEQTSGYTDETEPGDTGACRMQYNKGELEQKNCTKKGQAFLGT